MNAKRYLRGMLGQGWYNFTECLAEYSGTRDTSVRAFGNQHSGK